MRSLHAAWRGCIVRARPDGAPQVVAANVTHGWILTSPEPREFSPRRVVRYLVALRGGTVEPIVVLNKCDLLDAPALDAHLDALRAVAGGAPVLPLCARDGKGCDPLAAFLTPDATIALCGSSGVGKSTLINRLYGSDVMATRTSRSDGRGRHTTTVRRTFVLPNGAKLIDTPGMRAFSPWNGDVDGSFADIAEASARCRFSDCTHSTEPGCFVRDRVDGERLAQWNKLQREIEWHHSLDDPLIALERKRKWKSIHKAARRKMR